MRVNIPGHNYSLSNQIDPLQIYQTLQFVHIESAGPNQNPMVLADGIHEEELLRVLLDRMQYLQRTEATDWKEQMILKLKECLQLSQQKSIATPTLTAAHKAA